MSMSPVSPAFELPRDATDALERLKMLKQVANESNETRMERIAKMYANEQSQHNNQEV